MIFEARDSAGETSKKVEDVLAKIIVRFGSDVWRDSGRLQSLLNDYLGGKHDREINVLLGAAKYSVPSELLRSHGHIPAEMLESQLAARLEEKLAIKQEAARWGVAAWAIALSIPRPARAPNPSQPSAPAKPPTHAIPQGSVGPSAAPLPKIVVVAAPIVQRTAPPKKPPAFVKPPKAGKKNTARPARRLGRRSYVVLAVSVCAMIAGAFYLVDVARKAEDERERTVAEIGLAPSVRIRGHFLYAVPIGNGKTFVIGLKSTTEVRDTATGEFRQFFSFGSNAALVAPDEKTFVVVPATSSRTSTEICDLQTGGILRTIDVRFGHDMAITHDGATLVTSNFRGDIKLWNTTTFECVRTLVDRPTITASIPTRVAISDDGRIVVSQDGEEFRIWNARTGKPRLAHLRGDLGQSTYGDLGDIAISADGRTLYSARGATIEAWSTSSLERQRTFRMPDNDETHEIHSLLVSRDGTSLIAADRKSINLFDTRTGALLRTILPPKRSMSIRDVTATSDNRQIFAGTEAEVFVWKIP